MTRYCAWPMATTISTFLVVTYDFYLLCLTESSTSVWKYTNVKRQCVIVDVEAVLFRTSFQTWSKQVNNNIEKTMRRHGFYRKHWPFPMLSLRVGHCLCAHVGISTFHKVNTQEKHCKRHGLILSFKEGQWI